MDWAEKDTVRNPDNAGLEIMQRSENSKQEQN